MRAEAHPEAASLALRQDRYSLLAKRLRNYQVLAAVLLVVDLLATGGLVAERLRSKVVPYVVEVDGYGLPRAMGPTPETTRRDRRVIRALLADWIWHARTVSADTDLQTSFVRRAQSYTTGKARELLTEQLRETRNPFEMVREKTVAVEIESVLPLGEGEDDWELVWREGHRRHSGDLREEKWRALVTIDWRPPDDEAALALNPLGLQIETVSWARVGPLESETTR